MTATKLKTILLHVRRTPYSSNNVPEDNINKLKRVCHTDITYGMALHAYLYARCPSLSGSLRLENATSVCIPLVLDVTAVLENGGGGGRGAVGGGVKNVVGELTDSSSKSSDMDDILAYNLKLYVIKQ